MLVFQLKFQEPLCSSKEIDCVKSVKVDTKNCLKPCSGLIVTSFSENKVKKNVENLFPSLEDYNNYKKISKYPSEYPGNYGFLEKGSVKESGKLDFIYFAIFIY